MQSSWFFPDWPAPASVRAAVTTRLGGVSALPYAGFNLASHVGDAPEAVTINRQLLRQGLALPNEPIWLDQVHGCRIINVDANGERQGDAAYTQKIGVVCAVLTADCLPVLLCDRAGRAVAAAHAGWRGLAAGVLENSVTALRQSCGATTEILAWLGPAIGPADFEVGAEVFAAFEHLAVDAAFIPQNNRKWRADLYALARAALARVGVTAVYGGGVSTYSDPRFYSYRREPRTGRMASLIWLTETIA